MIALSEIQLFFYNVNFFFLNISVEKHVFLWWKLVVKNSIFFLTSNILDFLGHVVLPGTTVKKKASDTCKIM